MKGFKLKISKQIILEWMVALFMGASVLRGFFSLFTSSPSLLTAILLFLVLLVYLMVDKLSFRKILELVIPPLVVFILILITWILYPERHDFYLNGLYPIYYLLYPTSCIYILSTALLVRDKRNYINILKYYGILQFLGCVIDVMGVIQTGYWVRDSIYGGKIVTVISNYNLTWGYELLASCIIFTGIYLLYKKKIYIILIAICLAGILMYGSRGPLLMYCIYLVLLYLLYKPGKKGKRVMVTSVLFIVLLFLVSSGILQNLIIDVTSVLDISSRTIDKLLDGTIGSDSGRSLIYATVIQKILKNPIFGYGIYSDRFFMNTMVNGGSAYSHNIILELWLSFGIIGLIFFAYIIYKNVCFFRKISDIELRISLLVGIGGSLPLFLSLTFWTQPLFWFMLALLFNKRVFTINSTGFRVK